MPGSPLKRMYTCFVDYRKAYYDPDLLLQWDLGVRG